MGRLEEIEKIIGSGPGIGFEKELVSEVHRLRAVIEKHHYEKTIMDKGFHDFVDQELYKALEE